MNSWGEIILVVLALGMAIFIQLWVSRLRSPIWGLILPFFVFLASLCILVSDICHIRDGSAKNLTMLMALTYFACYNILTILFLCIYNFCQRTRLVKHKK